MSLTDLVDRGFITFYKKDGLYYLEFRPYLAYGVFTTDVITGKSLEDVYKQLMEKVFSKD